MPREIKVGLLVLVALAVLATGVFLIGEKNNLFVTKNSYTVRFDTVSGLETGNPVQLNGVTVGTVEAIVLPQRVDEAGLTVRVGIDRRYAERVREDSAARIKTIGLLGDKYVDVSSGSTAAAVIPAGGSIPAAPATDVDELLATGEDLAENVVAIAVSLRSILGRVERGEGLVGELITETPTGQEIKQAAREAATTLQVLLQQIAEGQGTVGRLLRDDSLARKVESTLDRGSALFDRIESGDNAVGYLLSDPGAAASLRQTLASIEQTSASMASLTGPLADGDGLLNLLLTDTEYGHEVAEDLRNLVRNLSLVSDKLNQGDGTLGQLINDPQVYDAVNDILVGVDESPFLRWLIRNRQKAGIEQRYEEEQGKLPAVETDAR